MEFDNRLGLFLHWGVYAMTGLHEQAFARYDLAREDYAQLYRSFNPVAYDPESWVLLAKQAGMRYICFTAKHHDGFCMWDTKYTDYSITHTPYGKDVLKLLADACRKHQMPLSIYYSNPDWHHPHGYNPASSHQWKAIRGEDRDFSLYKTYLKNQITELMTGYGKIYSLFWDIPPQMEDPSINALVRTLQPDILINDRGFDGGDFSTPEREFDGLANPPRYCRRTEGCNSIDASSWGYREHCEFYTYRTLLSAICKTMARGGSFLLNIGPRADGTLDPDHVRRIRRIGKWYQSLEGCLEQAEADPYDYRLRQNAGCIPLRKNGKTYLCFYDGLPTNCLSLGQYPGLPKQVRLMNTGQALPFQPLRLPGPNDLVTGIASHIFLHIHSIPADDLSQEPIVIELQWT